MFIVLKKIRKKNQVIDQDYVESKLESIELTIDKIKEATLKLRSITNLDLTPETKVTMETLVNKLQTV